MGVRMSLRVAGDIGAGAIQQVAQQAIANTQAKIAKVEALQRK